MDLSQERITAKEHQTARRGDAAEVAAQVGASRPWKEGIGRRG